MDPDPQEMLWEKKMLFIAVVKSSDSGAQLVVHTLVLLITICVAVGEDLTSVCLICLSYKILLSCSSHIKH